MGKQAPTRRPRRQPAPRPTGQKDQAGRRVPLVGIVLALTAVLAVVAALVTGRSGGDGSDAGLAQTRPVQVTGSPLPTHIEGAQDPAVGMAAPVLRGTGFDGTPVTIGGDGKATLVVFVAHWCPHCQRELPVLASWLEDGKLPPSVSLSVVSTAASQERPNWPPSACCATPA